MQRKPRRSADALHSGDRAETIFKAEQKPKAALRLLEIVSIADRQER